MPPRKYDSTVARMAGNIAGHFLDLDPNYGFPLAEDIARECVALARAIVKETIRTEPPDEPKDA